MQLGRAKSFAIGLVAVPVLAVALGTMTAFLSSLILDLGRDTKFSFEATMDGPALAAGVSAVVLLVAYGVTLRTLREHVSVLWVLCGTFVAPVVTAVLLAIAFIASGGQVGPR